MSAIEMIRQLTSLKCPASSGTLPKLRKSSESHGITISALAIMYRRKAQANAAEIVTTTPLHANQFSLMENPT
jgi:hypothetical protein